ncbi:General transcription and DNA repair factor IIH subunit tfb1 [Psilocybe cubensis]|uniref:General transcription and DNA repair factor IIH subunit tfb1 n=2 Tax=Psilocybe cubensis TaxID=181762 RepID=A0ACB8HB11_PSICU|nr:General transcription and DNA repair factor IIH subunit tfb1 [Psilocybe cubensis]KAH9485121.1 General transcription and DNA repair factor IIH subunit tfb1 [Psilocybe cubensis]
MPTTVCTAKASCKKLPGLLELTDTHLQWTQDGKKAPSIRVAYAEASSLFCSKEGAAQVKLKLSLVGDDTGHNFTFTSPPAVAIAEREKFKQELTTIISRNRSASDPFSRPVIPPINASIPLSTAQTPTTQTPRPLPTPSRQPPSRAVSVASDRRATPVIVGNDPASEFRLRKKVLLANPELGQLHRDLVVSGHITEAEFWDGREHLILAQAAAEGQKKGKSGQLVDPRPEAVEGGEIKIRITPQLVHDIFDEYPIVQKAYSENVTSKLTEEQFWKRYFQSKLFNAHRASIRSSAAQHVVKDDPIFDKYLERDDDELEPRRPREEHVEVFVDLAATLEDHEETGNEKDVTMRAGRQKAALPLIRKFNEHSERLLNSALGEIPPAKRRRLDPGEDIYSQIDIDDLHDPEATNGIILEMQDRQRYFEARMSEANQDGSLQKLDPAFVLAKARASVDQWDVKLTQLKIERKQGDAALLAMTQNVANRLDVRSKKNDIPDGLFRQMTSCQTAANEFLRQFWLATYPPAGELQTVAVATPQQRAAKQAKMIGYISKTPERVNALVQVAKQYGIDANRVEIALKPVVQASEHALTFWRNRKPPKPQQ